MNFSTSSHQICCVCEVIGLHTDGWMHTTFPLCVYFLTYWTGRMRSVTFKAGVITSFWRKELWQPVLWCSSTASDAAEAADCLYRRADKSLAQQGRRQTRKHVRNASDFNNIETRAAIKFFFFCKARRRRKWMPFWQKHYLVFFLVGLRTYQQLFTLLIVLTLKLDAPYFNTLRLSRYTSICDGRLWRSAP